MIKYVISLCFCLFINAAWAHQPDVSSTVLMEQKDGTWLLQIKAALTAFEYEVEATQGANSYATPEEFRALVLAHLQKNIQIKSNGNNLLSLQKGYVQLGHETNVLFQLVGMPDSLATLQVSNNSFKDIHHHKSTLVVLKNGFQQQQFSLDKKNQYNAQLKANNNSFALITDSSSTSIAAVLILSLFLIVTLLLLLGYRKKVLLA